jgi:methyl-accepting chemotaxis protein
MEEIVTSVKRVTDIMSEIATASLEQSSGIDQVNKAVTQMDEVTQQNAALVEQAAAAAESLEEQAETLAETTAHFRLDFDICTPKTHRNIGHQSVKYKPTAHLANIPAKPMKNAIISANASQESDDAWTEV